MAISATSAPAALAPRRDNVWQRRVVNHILIFAALIAAWEEGSRLGWLDPLTTPRPSDIARSVFTIYVDQRNVYWHFFVTFVEAMVGFVIGSAAGVGLAIAAELVRAHAGTIALIDKPGPGASFEIVIPDRAGGNGRSEESLKQ